MWSVTGARLILAPPPRDGLIDLDRYPDAPDTAEGRAALEAHQRLGTAGRIYRVVRDGSWWRVVGEP